jgi:Domain of unknown function (DUF4352)
MMQKSQIGMGLRDRNEFRPIATCVPFRGGVLYVHLCRRGQSNCPFVIAGCGNQVSIKGGSTVRRSLSLLVVVIALLANSLGTVFAQDPATPEAGAATSSIIYGSDGQPEGEISVSSLVDPFEEFDSSGAPQRGFHYVMAVVTITSTGDAPLEAASYGFYAVDEEGFQYSPTYLFRDSESMETTPDFAGGTIEAGQSMSGAIFFQLLDGTSVGLILYQPSFDRLITAADLREGDVAAEGDAVEIINSDGSPGGTITVDERIEPLEGVSSGAERGFEFVGITVTIENTGDQPLSIEPYSFYITDEEGFSYTSYGAYRDEEAEAALPSLPYGTVVEPGAAITGLVSYQILNGTKIGLVYYAPSYDRHVRLAEYADDRAPGLTGEEPTFEVTPADEDFSSDEETPVAVTPGCEGVLEWAESSIPLILAWSEAYFTVADFVDSGNGLSPADARDAADAAAGLAAAQEEIDVPDIAQDGQDALISVFEQTATGLDDLATALENGDDAGIDAARSNLAAIATAVDDGGEFDKPFTVLEEQCPEIDTVGE